MHYIFMCVKECRRAGAVLERTALGVQLLNLNVVSHQLLAIALMRWMIDLCKESDPLRRIICASLLSCEALLSSTGTGFVNDETTGADIAGPSNESYANSRLANMFTRYTALWKTARVCLRELLLNAFMPDLDLNWTIPGARNGC